MPDSLPDHATVEAFYASDLDGDSLTIEINTDDSARRSYDAFLVALLANGQRETGMYLDRHQAERLRDYLNEVLATPRASDEEKAS